MKKKIGWQKYESVIEEQLDSPILKKLVSQVPLDLDMEMDDFEDEHMEIHAANVITLPVPIPIPHDVASEVSVTTNFDCWLGYTNFELTESMKKQLDKIEGIELFQIRHRYRFFIGIGKMFDFTTVRQKIEETFLE